MGFYFKTYSGFWPQEKWNLNCSTNTSNWIKLKKSVLDTFINELVTKDYRLQPMVRGLKSTISNIIPTVIFYAGVEEFEIFKWRVTNKPSFVNWRSWTQFTESLPQSATQLSTSRFPTGSSERTSGQRNLFLVLL